jgi:hypothetical protein
VTDGVDTSVDGDELPDLEAVADRPLGRSELEQLVPRHVTVLPVGEEADPGSYLS